MRFNIALFTESLWMLFRIPIGYSTPLTMTDESSKIQRGCQSDASVPRPTIIACVPLVLDRIQKKIKEKIEGEKRQSSIWPWSTRMNGLITDTTLPFLIRELIRKLFFFFVVWDQ
jgi:long-subunit acyl-CoA synthetase (AMP-forming)